MKAHSLHDFFNIKAVHTSKHQLIFNFVT